MVGAGLRIYLFNLVRVSGWEKGKKKKESEERKGNIAFGGWRAGHGRDLGLIL